MKSLLGIGIVESPYLPKKPRFRLAENVPVTSAFRADFNEWARTFFGEEDCIYIIGGNMFVNPDVVAKLIALESK